MTTTCGGHGHSPECLCDVVITDVIPINYHFDEVWHAGIVARANGYKGEGGDKLADFLEALGSAYDATRRIAGEGSDWLADLDAADVKARVEAQLQDGHSIIDVPDLIGESFERIVAAVTGCQPCLLWTWDNVQWLKFEAYIYTKATHSPSDLAERFGLVRPQCANLLRLYGKGFDSDVQKSKAARAAELFEEHQESSAAELRDMLLAEGHTYSLDGVLKARQRWRFRREGVYAAAAMITLTIMVKLMLIADHAAPLIHQHTA